MKKFTQKHTSQMETLETTMFKSFANVSDLITKTANKKIYIELSNGYFIPVTKTDVKKIAKTMETNEDKFCGQITFLSGQSAVQIKLAK